MLNRTAGWALSALLFAAAASHPAVAEAAYLDGGSCVESGIPCSVAGTCMDDLLTCVGEGAAGRCEPVDAVQCCLPSMPCEGFPDRCQPVDSLGASGSEPWGICLDDPERYCDGSDAAIERCHSSATGGTLVGYEYGDCDGDGEPNSDDDSICPPPRAIQVGAGCMELQQCRGLGPCMFAGSPGTCFDLEGTLLCGPNVEFRAALFCGDDFVCPAASPAEADVGGQLFCVPSPCAGQPHQNCITTEGSPSVAVPWTLGDCDRDGQTNAAEFADPGRDECLFESEDAGPPDPDAGPPDPDAGPLDPDAGPLDPDAGPLDPDAGPLDPDAGPPDEDAGPPGPDAGSVSDAGPGLDAGAPNGGDASSSFDAGPERNVRFGGGGGCACRTSPAQRRSPAWLGALIVGLALVRRRRLPPP